MATNISNEETKIHALLKNRIFNWTLVILWAGGIFFLSSQSDLQISPDTVTDFILRKIAHIVVFGVLAVLFARALKQTPVWVPLVLTIFYAISDELHQHMVPTRHGTVTDVLIDTIGATIGLILWKYYQRLKNKQ